MGSEIQLTKKFRSETNHYSIEFPYLNRISKKLLNSDFDNKHEVIPGRDFIIMGSDGFFDNLYDHDIEKCLLPNIKAIRFKKNEFELVDPQNVANCIASKA